MTIFALPPHGYFFRYSRGSKRVKCDGLLCLELVISRSHKCRREMNSIDDLKTCLARACNDVTQVTLQNATPARISGLTHKVHVRHFEYLLVYCDIGL